MKHIIGLGNVGCKLCDYFSKYPEYKIYKIDIEKKKEKRYVSILKQPTPEDYESKFPTEKVKRFFKTIKKNEEVYFVTSGGIISSISLRVLELVKENKITIIYIKPDIDLIGGIKKLQERVTYNILQEYTRSAVFESMYIIHNTMLEKQLIEEVPLSKFYEELNNVFVTTFQMINYYRNTQPYWGSISKPNETSRICTIGGLNEKKGEILCFDLDNVREKEYYYIINKKTLEKDTKLLSNIRENFLNERNKDNKIQVSYSVYQSDYEDDFCYIVVRSNQIQK